MRKCENCGANLDSGERCGCEKERENLDRAFELIKAAVYNMRVADGLLRECGIVPCGTLTTISISWTESTGGTSCSYRAGKPLSASPERSGRRGRKAGRSGRRPYTVE